MDRNKVYWASRRGMLELDLVLMPFAQNVYPSLNQQQQQRFKQLLAQEDQDLFVWLMRRQQPEDPELRQAVDQVLAHAGVGDA